MPRATTRQTKEKGTREGTREAAKGQEEGKTERIYIGFISESRRKSRLLLQNQSETSKLARISPFVHTFLSLETLTYRAHPFFCRVSIDSWSSSWGANKRPSTPNRICIIASSGVFCFFSSSNTFQRALTDEEKHWIRSGRCDSLLVQVGLTESRL